MKRQIVILIAALGAFISACGQSDGTAATEAAATMGAEKTSMEATDPSTVFYLPFSVELWRDLC